MCIALVLVIKEAIPIRASALLSNKVGYGTGCVRTEHTYWDQLWRADAGSWQIADGGATRKAAAGGTSVGDLRVHFGLGRDEDSTAASGRPPMSG
eukprot:scaffold10674_cov62-Phaeocystis_antarctica.AAC.4